jgi:hypothetical protein
MLNGVILREFQRPKDLGEKRGAIFEARSFAALRMTVVSGSFTFLL